MNNSDKKRVKRPTIQYYQVPACRKDSPLKRYYITTLNDCNNNSVSLNRNDENNNCVDKNSEMETDILNNRRYGHDNRFYDERNICTSSSLTSTQTYEDSGGHNHSDVVRGVSEVPLPKNYNRHRKISVDLSCLKSVVHRHINAEILSQTLQQQIRMNKYLSWHKPSDLKLLFSAYKDRECSKEDYLNILKIMLKDICNGKDPQLTAEFCSVLLEKDCHKEKGERICIQTFLTGLEDLIIDYKNPGLKEEKWRKFLKFLAELFFFAEEKLNICSLYLFPLISYALNITL